MRLLDRYILKEFLGPFLFGMGAFIVVVVGVQMAPNLLELLVRDNFPPLVVARIFVLRLPQVLVYCFPMATVFGALMAMSNMSGNGEIIAVRAGGASVPRVALPIMCVAVLISGMNFFFNEALVPLSLDRAVALQNEYARKLRPVENLLFAIPKVQPQRVVYARSFDPRRMALEGVVIMELRNGELWQTLKASEAVWKNGDWLLRDVEFKRLDAAGRETSVHFSVRAHDLGKTPDELAKRPKKLDDMSLADLREELALRRRIGLPYRPDQVKVVQYIHMHWALPWLPTFFAFIGIPLGLRPARATSGIGMGLSLVIALSYYLMFYSLVLIGQQGAINTVLAAWLPNGVLLVAGAVLFARAQ
ncbi:MAG: LptF/LptG family permease [Armatimonadetes bacterium]|nr:LptF/LptG family permease [Armatimonadota bacterium]